MSTIGKVLALFNLLAAAGFVCLAVMDYSKRQAWSYAVVEQEFAIRGLPVDDQEPDPDREGEKLVKVLGKQMLQDLFSGAGQSVPTQKAEVEQRKRALADAVANAPDDKAKRQILSRSLLPLTQTFGERTDLAHRLESDKVEDLMGPDGPFEASFREATQSKASPSNWENRRRAIAHVLINMGEQPENYQNRVLAVVGARSYAREVAAQGLALRAMVPQLQLAIADDRNAFISHYKQLVAQIEALTERNRQLDVALDAQSKLRDEHAAIVKNRQAEVAAVIAQIQAVKTETQAELVRQGQLEAELFDTQNKIGRTTEVNLKLEHDIRAKETH